MRFTTPGIAWNSTQPVFSVDFHSSGRLATAGADKVVNIWRVESDGSVTFLSNLAKHTRAVNAIRFSPDGQLLATTGDDGVIYVWKLADGETRQVQGMMDSNAPIIEKKEEWNVVTTLNRSINDVYALDWSADSTQLVVGAFDGAVYIWHLTKTIGPRYHEIRDHTTLVQGVAFDPLGSMMVTQSADRSVRIYKKSKKGRKLFCAHHIRERETDIEVAAKKEAGDEDDDSPQHFHHKYFLDDSAATFFRRPAWSPEGQFLLLPCGQVIDSPSQSEPANASWIFTRADMGKVAACCLPSNEISIAARFSPVLYKSRRRSSTPASSEANPSGEANSSSTSTMDGVEESDNKDSKNTFKLFDIDYRLVFAIATVTSILIYDTEHSHPIAALQDAHYSTLTDLSFSADGNILAVSSSDGYVSLIQFDQGELGEVLDKEHYDRVMAPVLEARVPKAPEPRKPKKTSATTDSTASANVTDPDQKQDQSATSAANGSSKHEGDEEDDDEDDDSEVDEEEALNGTIINFDDPAAPEQEKKPVAPVVRKEGRRVVATLISAPSASAMDVTPSDPSANDKPASSSS